VAEFDAAIKADGYAVPAVDSRSEAQIEHDEAYGQGARDPSDYEIKYPRGTAPDSELAAFDAQAKQLLADINLPPAIGGRILEHAFQVAAELRAMTPEQQTFWKQSGFYQLQQAYPGNKLEEASQSIKNMLALAGKDNMIVELFKEGGLLNDPWLFKTLAIQAQHQQTWKAGRPK